MDDRNIFWSSRVTSRWLGWSWEATVYDLSSNETVRKGWAFTQSQAVHFRDKWLIKMGETP